MPKRQLPLQEKTALVVDESRSDRYAMRKLLESAGYTVDTTESAQDAYVYLQRRHPQVIFLDHQMPGSDGLKVLRALKNDIESADIPVVLCSVQQQESFHQIAKEAGAAAVLLKPPDARQIKALLRHLAGDTEPALMSTTGTRKTPSLGLPPRKLPAGSMLRPQPPVTNEVENASNPHTAESTETDDGVSHTEILELRRAFEQLQKECVELRQLQERNMSPERLLPALLPSLLQMLEQPIRNHAQRAAAQILQRGAARMLQEARAPLEQTDDSNKA